MKAVRPCSATVVSLTLVLVVALSSAQQNQPRSGDAPDTLSDSPLVLGGQYRLAAQQQRPVEYDYLLLATNRTSTMEEEMQEASDSGYAFVGVMGGETSFGGSEVVVVMQREPDSDPRFEYRLLATSKTSTLQKEMQEAGDAGFEYRGQTVFNTTFGGDEPVVILERSRDSANRDLFEYRLLATNRTSTMQDELHKVGLAGFNFVGVTVASTTFGGNEIVAILKRAVTE